MAPVLPLLPRPAFGQPLPALGEDPLPHAFGIDPHALVLDPQAFGFEPHALEVEPQALRLAPQALRELPQALSARQALFAAKLAVTRSQTKAPRRKAISAGRFMSAASAVRRFDADTNLTEKDCRFIPPDPYGASPDGRLAIAGNEPAETLFAEFSLAISYFAAAMPFIRP